MNRVFLSKINRNREINSITLNSINTIDFTRTIEINNNIFYTANPCIIKHPTDNDKYIFNIRWVNYNLLTPNSSLKNIISTNSYFLLDSNFNKITDEIFAKMEVYNKDRIFGLEDVRLYSNQDNLYYIGIRNINNIFNVTMNDINMNTYDFKLNLIKPSFYKGIKDEKNWALFNYKNEMKVIHSWYPLKICSINNNKLDVLEIKQTPLSFSNVRGSTCGCIVNNEIWFLVHRNINSNYVHLFVVFDLNMNLLRYSEDFKFNNSKVEFCIGMIIDSDRTILSYSEYDQIIKIGIYDNNYIKNNIKWYS